ncbi:transposase [Kitasatospora purpeofusca]|uniref:transposase n=1 Tax=Kitasatospora purpeofusca TaxID=67352 RepID=UPI0036749C5C
MLVADTPYGANADFRHGLEDRHLAYVLQAKGEMTAHQEDAEPHCPPPRILTHQEWWSAQGRHPGSRARGRCSPLHRSSPVPSRWTVKALGSRSPGRGRGTVRQWPGSSRMTSRFSPRHPPRLHGPSLLPETTRERQTGPMAPSGSE